MALGGGSFTAENRILPGAYINFVSAASANTEQSARGTAAMGFALDWGPENTVLTLTAEDLYENSVRLFARAASDEKLTGLRELFKNARTLYAYRLNEGGAQAENTFAKARFAGARGNDLSVAVEAAEDGGFLVRTLLAGSTVDEQTVKTAAELSANDFLFWKKDAELAATAGMPLAGGTDGTVTAAAHERFLRTLEPYAFNTLGAVTEDKAIKALYVSFTKNMRDEMGVKFQTVLYREAADHPGVVNVWNEAEGAEKAALVYWVTGALAACELHRSCQNTVYDGELTIDTDFTQKQLAQAIEEGKFLLHRVGSEARVLADVNSLVTQTEAQGSLFRENQTVRVIDQIACDIAVLFRDKYLGTVPNDEAGRISLWSDIVRRHEELAQARAIEGFSEDDISVGPGKDKKSVVVRDCIQTVGTMSRLYMTVTVA